MHLRPRTWRTDQLIAAGKLAIGDGYRAKNSELSPSGLPFARAGNIDGGFQFVDADYYPDAALHRVGDKVSRPGDVVFTSKGTVGRFAFVRNDTPRFVFSPQLCYWRSLDERTIDSRFLYFWIQGEEFKEQADAVKGQTDMADYVSLTDQRRMFITLPPIDEQRAISAILSALDDKVELNRQMNHTLEEMASALFKSWFVDFDPIAAMADGRKPYGIDARTTALFPTGFQDSEMGVIPLGWNATTVAACVGDVFDGPHATPPEAASGAVFLGIGNMTGTGIDLANVRRIAEADWERWTRRVTPAEGDIVFTYEAALGRFALVPPGLRCCLGRRMALVRPRVRRDATFLFHQFVAAPFQEVVAASSWTGSTVDRTPLTEFPEYPFLWPGDALVERFSESVDPMWALIHQNQSESRTLAALRDTLLPKLLCGEVSLKQAEKAVEAAI